MLRYSLLLVLFLQLSFSSFGQTPVWAHSFGSTGTDVGFVTKVAPNGNVYVAGQFSGTIDLDPSAAVYNITSNGLTDMYLACYAPSGAFLWGFGVGGGYDDAILTIAFDSASNVVVGGFFHGASIDFDPGTGTSTLSETAGTTTTNEGDGFVAKYTASGAFIFAKDLGAETQYDFVRGVDVDVHGNVYIAGFYTGTMVVSSTLTMVSTVSGKIYLIKLDPSGNLIWGESFGLPGYTGDDASPKAIKVSNGHIYICGILQGTCDFDPSSGVADLTAVGLYDAFIAKYDTNGNYIFAKSISGTGNSDIALFLTLDQSENIYVTGQTNSSALTFNPSAPATSTVSAPGGGGTFDYFLAKYDSAGTYQWGHVTGSSGDDIGNGVEISNGFLYTTGMFHNTVDFDPSGAVTNLTSNGGYDMFTCKYSLAGDFLCGFNVGSSTDDIGYGLGHDASGNILETGQFSGSSVDFDPTSGSYLLSSAGSSDIYLAKYRYFNDSVISGFIYADTICPGAAVYATLHIISGPSGPYTITLSSAAGTTTIPGVISGAPFTIPLSVTSTTYFAVTSIVTPAIDLCTNIVTTSIGGFPVIVHSNTVGVTDSIFPCNTIHFQATPGYSSYSWNFGDGSTATTNPVIHIYSASGTFNPYVTVTTASGCHFTDTVHLTVNSLPLTNLGPDIAFCEGSSVTLGAAAAGGAGYSYLWSTGDTSSSITVYTGGTYSLITSAAGCTTTDTINVSMDTIFPVHLGLDTFVCPASTITLQSSVAYPPSAVYHWSTGATTNALTVSGAGTFVLTVSVAGCVSSDTVHVDTFLNPLVHVRDTAFCIGTAVTLASTDHYPAGTTYLWSNGAVDSSISVTLADTFWLHVTVHGCHGADTAVVSYRPTPLVTLGHDTAFCKGGSITIIQTEPAGSTYHWSTGATGNSLTINATGAYWLAVTDSGCTATDTINVTVYPIPVVTLGSDVTVCQGQPVTLQSSNTYTSPTYHWSTGATTATINPTASGTYSLTVTQNGCPGTGSVNVTVNPVPLVLLGNDSFFCAGSSITLSTNPPQSPTATFLWSNGSTDTSIAVNQPGVYSVVVTDGGCFGSDSVNINEVIPPFVYLGPDTIVCFGTSVQLYMHGDHASYLWSDSSTGATFVATHAGIYTATISNSCGSFSDTLIVAIKPCGLFVPSAFTPNNDSKNDVFKILGNFSEFTDIHFFIYNRWGQLVFSSQDPTVGWDGTFNGVPQELGTYCYYLSYHYGSEKGDMKGDFELIR